MPHFPSEHMTELFLCQEGTGSLIRGQNIIVLYCGSILTQYDVFPPKARLLDLWLLDVVQLGKHFN